MQQLRLAANGFIAMTAAGFAAVMDFFLPTQWADSAAPFWDDGTGFDQ